MLPARTMRPGFRSHVHTGAHGNVRRQALALPGRAYTFHAPRIPRATRLPPHAILIRKASTVATDARSAGTRTKNFFLGFLGIFSLAFGYFYITDTRASAHRYIAVPLLRFLFPDAEDAHEAGTALLRSLYSLSLHPRERGEPAYSDVPPNPSVKRDPNDTRIEVFGQLLANPLAISAGLDKDAAVPDALFALGAAVVEVGGVTPLPQEGNPRPRVFRVEAQDALVNRYGLNSAGADVVRDRLRARMREYADSLGLGFGLGPRGEDYVLSGAAGVPAGSLAKGRLLAVQIAKNKETRDADVKAVRADYVSAATKLAPYADIIVVNVSSPNTPGLRGLQASEPLEAILTGVVGAARAVERPQRPRVMVKVSPDEDSEAQVLGVARAVWASGIDGVIVGNTTKRRPPFSSEAAQQEAHLSRAESAALAQTGGYSSPLTFPATLALIKKYRRVLDEALAVHPDMSLEPKVIFASGGIDSGDKALAALNAGASVAMMYTGVTYGGVGTVTRVKGEMRRAIAQSAGGKGVAS